MGEAAVHSSSVDRQMLSNKLKFAPWSCDLPKYTAYISSMLVFYLGGRAKGREKKKKVRKQNRTETEQSLQQLTCLKTRR
ncbi:hypothetical protein VN97_g12371 [Penicillium thymicola]|uniref:Uncharacterized protein n=1 Tax=Penicillium thymicola TaxID=293382 RepID=A0AAI9T6F3_PENTH|nr:hypothetical protein VN97_g12371 [Penicillium thymicola]